MFVLCRIPSSQSWNKFLGTKTQLYRKRYFCIQITHYVYNKKYSLIILKVTMYSEGVTLN